HGSKKVGRIYVSETTTIPNVVSGILKMATDIGELIELLRLCGHGNSGVQQIGQYPPGLNQTSASHFRSLVGKFDSSGKGIELHGCGIASDTNIVKGVDKNDHAICKPGTDKKGGVGYNFLKALADAAQVKVTGAINCQKADANYDWEGATVTVGPTAPAATP